MQNKFPYKTFIWKGIDGSEVISHMAPQGNYNSTATPMAIVKSDMGNPQEKEIGKALLVYGIGDGGGGPGEAPLELLDRQTDCKGLDKVVRRHAVEFFEDLEKSILKLFPSMKGNFILKNIKALILRNPTVKSTTDFWRGLCIISNGLWRWQRRRERNAIIRSWRISGKKFCSISSTILYPVRL